MKNKTRLLVGVALVIIVAALGIALYRAITLRNEQRAYSRLKKLVARYARDYTVSNLGKRDGMFFAKVTISDADFVKLWQDTGTIYDTYGLVWQPPFKNMLVKFEVNTVPKLCIILDDAGYRFKPEVDWVTSIKHLNPTVSILPKLQYSRRVNEYLRKEGIVTMLHLPLQPHRWPRLNPGPGLILVRDSADRIRAKFDEDLASVGPVEAVNNHEGSAFAENAEKMRVLLRHIYHQHKLFFIDSRTTKFTVVPRVAQEENILFLQKDRFIDNKRDVDYVLEQLEILARKARKRGYAIGIGHTPRKPTFIALKQFAKANPDIRFVNVVQLYELKKLGLLKK